MNLIICTIPYSKSKKSVVWGILVKVWPLCLMRPFRPELAQMAWWSRKARGMAMWTGISQVLNSGADRGFPSPLNQRAGKGEGWERRKEASIWGKSPRNIILPIISLATNIFTYIEYARQCAWCYCRGRFVTSSRNVKGTMINSNRPCSEGPSHSISLPQQSEGDLQLDLRSLRGNDVRTTGHWTFSLPASSSDFYMCI